MRKIPEISGIETGKVSQFSPSEARPFRIMSVDFGTFAECLLLP
jgi:hypothetical protein